MLIEHFVENSVKFCFITKLPYAVWRACTLQRSCRRGYTNERKSKFYLLKNSLTNMFVLNSQMYDVRRHISDSCSLGLHDSRIEYRHYLPHSAAIVRGASRFTV